MRATTLLAILLPIMLQQPVRVLGCLQARAETSNSGTGPAEQFPYPIMGSDNPADSATTGYFINHLAITVRNLTRSIDFYSTAFGLRLMFTLRVSKHISISYMGHSHGGRNGTGYQTAIEINRQKNNIEGLIELLHVDVPKFALTSSTKVPNTFGHIGVVVPDIKATQARLEKLGAKILKGHGEESTRDGRQKGIANASGLSDDIVAQLDQAEIDAVTALLNIQNKPLIFLEDPDGNLIEVQNQEGSQLVN